MMRDNELLRAQELLRVYETAADLKKEKCYAFNNVEVEGKTLKELRYINSLNKRLSFFALDVVSILG